MLVGRSLGKRKIGSNVPSGDNPSDESGWKAVEVGFWSF